MAEFGYRFSARSRFRSTGIPLRSHIPSGLRVTGVALADQVKSLDWRARQVEFICTLPAETVPEVLAKLATLLSGPV